jgi:hypothetical protein
VPVAGTTVASVGVAAASVAVARSLLRSNSRVARAAGRAAAGYGVINGIGAVALAASATANDIAYQRRMEGNGRKFGYTPATRGERIQREIVDTRKKLRSERANYDRPLDGKPIEEAGLPDFGAAHSFLTATKSAFPADTQFTTSIKRVNYGELKGGDLVQTERAMVETRFVKGGMTGRNTRSFFRDGNGDLVTSHDMFTIRGEGQGSGIGKQVVKAQFDEYEKLGVKRVGVHANIDVGGYAWARFGLTPSQKGWDSLRKSLKRRTEVSVYEPIAKPKDDEERDYNAQVARVLGLMDELGEGPVKMTSRERRAVRKILNDPDPRAIWKVADARIGGRNIGKELLMNTHWNGEIRLDDPDAMQRFNHYTGRNK